MAHRFVHALMRRPGRGVTDGLRAVDRSSPSFEPLRVNDVLLLSEGHPRTAERSTAAGLRVVGLPTGQVDPLDAGLSCPSLRWRPCSGDDR